MDFSQLFTALRDNPYPAMLTVAILAIGWLVKSLVNSYDARAKELKATNDAHDLAIDAAHAAHLATAMQVAPLASKLVDCVAAVERLSTARGA